jgi:hypothetical protein
MTKRTALVSAMLLAGLMVAVIGATAALRFVGGGAFGPGGQPLTPADVQQSLAQQPAAQQPAVQQSPAAQPRRSATARATQHPTRPPASHPAPVSGSFTTSGGTVYANCLSGQVRLTSWVPAQGYLTDGYSRGPGTSAWVKFKSSSTELTVTAACGGGRPRFTTAADNRGGGGGGEERHGGGGGGSGGGGPGPSGGRG